MALTPLPCPRCGKPIRHPTASPFNGQPIHLRCLGGTLLGHLIRARSRWANTITHAWLKSQAQPSCRTHSCCAALLSPAKDDRDPPAFESANDQNAQCDCDEQQYRPTVKHDSRQLPSMGISVNQVAPAWGRPAAENAGGSARSPVAVAYQLR
jgi:hypothetical protein